MTRRLSLAAALAFLLLGATSVAPFPVEDRRFEDAARRYIEGEWAYNPSWATTWGRHEYDLKLEDRSRATIDREIARTRAAIAGFEAMDAGKLSGRNRIDHALVLSQARGHLLELTEIRPWERNPSSYGYGDAVFGLMARTFAPPEKRLRAVIARLSQVPALYAAARENLKNPPALFTRFAASECEGQISFLDTEVPLAFADVRDSALWREYRAAAARAADATRAYGRWLNDTLLPRSNGTYVLGEDTYRKKLRYQEMIDLPIDTLLVIGERELQRLTARYRAAARRIDPTAPLDSLVARMRRDHPAPDSLLPYVEGLLEEIRTFSIRSRFCDVPSEVRCRVRPTPDYAAARSFASLDAPGPFETKADEAYFNVTVPDRRWPPERVEEHMAGYSRWSLPSVCIHEAYPGHYVNFLYAKNAPTFVRRSLGSGSFAEGWALYAEEGMLDQGFRKQDPRIEFGVMRWALTRACRFQVGIRVHTRGMSMEDATRYFVDHADMEPANAQREAYRAAFDPTYLIYTAGALEIRKLRDDWRRREGAEFDLAKFHAAILSQGALPIPLLRRMFLQDSGPSL
jgi:uncharacterized protein (DUF885 family)